MLDNSKVRFLHNRVKRPGLKSATEALNNMKMTCTSITFIMDANHLSTEVLQLLEYLKKNRNISYLSIRDNPEGGGQNDNSGSGSSIYNYYIY